MAIPLRAGTLSATTVYVGLPVYNGEGTLAAALESLLQQSYRDIAIVVADNGSTDRTAAIALDYASQDSRVTVARAPVNRGATWNFNRLLDASGSANLFMWAAHDDLWAPSYVADCVQGLLSHPDVVLCATQARFLDLAGILTEEVDIGVSTVGLPRVQRALKYLLEVERNSVFYGVYRRAAIARRRLVDRIGNDQLFLFDLCLTGELLTLPVTLLTRRRGGVSRTAKSIYSGLGTRQWVPAKFFRADIYARFLRCVAVADVLTPDERRVLWRGVIGTGVRRHLLPNLSPRRFLWWLRHGGTSQHLA